MTNHWKRQPEDFALAKRIARDFRLSPIIAQLLINRNLKENDDIQKFLNPSLEHLPSPQSLPNIDKAVRRIVTALEEKQKVVIFGDYDVDGITATALLTRFLQAVGAKIEAYIPNRFTEGYGLSLACLPNIKVLDPDLIITVDCGTTASDAVSDLQHAGIDVIITDHHLPEEELPGAYAIVNPMLQQIPDELQSLCGAGVAFYLAIALRSELRSIQYFHKQNIKEPNLFEYLDLVALATLADLVHIGKLNRILVAYGLKKIQKNPHVGLKALLKLCAIPSHLVKSDTVSFQLIPRINAAGRIGKAKTALRFLLATEDSEAWPLAVTLDQYNRERQSIEKKVFHDALKQAMLATPQPSILILHSDTWHQGVIGIVAAKLMNRFSCPVILIAFDETGIGRASCRSIEEFHITDALSHCADHLIQYGGHACAAGFSIAKDKLNEFSITMTDYIETIAKQTSMERTLAFEEHIDLDQVCPKLLEELQCLEPFGNGNPEPFFVSRYARVQETRIVSDLHLSLRLAGTDQSFNAMGFNMSWRPPPQREDHIDILYRPNWNYFRGKQSIQLLLKDFKHSTP